MHKAIVPLVAISFHSLEWITGGDDIDMQLECLSLYMYLYGFTPVLKPLGCSHGPI